MPETAQFKACYRHPKQPAVKNCQYCEQPICRECEKESGDHRMCGPCKKKLVSRAAMAAGPQPQRAQFELGEVTVFRDGTVVAPEQAPVAPESLRVKEDDGAQDGHADEEPALPGQSGATTTAPNEVNADEKAGQTERSGEKPGGLSQVAYALPFTLATDICVAGTWLLVAVILKQWTQISVLTLGLAVPWVFYNATMRKKRAGERVWTESPVVLVSIISFTLVAVTAPLLEFLVFKVVFSGFKQFDAFAREYFNGVGWALISLGLAFSLLTPFLLKIGARWDVPRLRLRRRRKPVGL